VRARTTVNIKQIFDSMPSRYIPGSVDKLTTYYFSIGDEKYTVKITKEAATVENGKTVENADVILKTTPELFEKMVLHGKAPGPIDIARGKIKTNDPMGLQKLRTMFKFS
jgi:putative sterol carrier protein